MDARELPEEHSVTAILRRAWLKGAVSTATAFVLALQMLLVSVLATQMAAAAPADPFVICYGEGHSQGGDESQPGTDHTRIHHASCVICALASFAPPLADVVQSLATTATADTVALSHACAPPRADRSHDPRSSQGPPQAA
jgi:hypothetical protein